MPSLHRLCLLIYHTSSSSSSSWVQVPAARHGTSQDIKMAHGMMQSCTHIHTGPLSSVDFKVLPIRNSLSLNQDPFLKTLKTRKLFLTLDSNKIETWMKTISTADNR